MGKRRYDKRWRKRRRDRRDRDERRYRGRLGLWLGDMERGRGYDGVLRGKPEPVVLLAAFDCTDGTPRPVHQHLVRFYRPHRIPGRVEAKKQERHLSRTPLPRGANLALLAIAMEEDNGQGILNLYSVLRDHQQLIAWPTNQPDHFPCPLPAYAVGLGAEGVQTELMIDNDTLGDLCKGDNYVGTSVFFRRVDDRIKDVVTCRIVTEDRRNDWHLKLQLTVS